MIAIRSASDRGRTDWGWLDSRHTVSFEGGLQHQDSTGGGGVIRPGEIQFMRAGTGVTHSEYNASKTEPVHFLQIWVEPGRRGLAPRYDQKPFDAEVLLFDLA